MVTVPTNLKIYNMAYEFVLEIYKILDTFPESERDNVVDQLRRASTSLPLNIAEGCGTNSDRLFMNYLSYAYNSSKEIEVLLKLSNDLNYINSETYERLFSMLDIFRMHLYRFMQSLDDAKGHKFFLHRKFNVHKDFYG